MRSLTHQAQLPHLRDSRGGKLMLRVRVPRNGLEFRFGELKRDQKKEEGAR